MFCASCVTPHHDECFAENSGCSLLGCEETRSVASDAPSMIDCAKCSKSTQAGANHCSWCGAALREAHLKPAFGWKRVLVAAAVLLITVFPIGLTWGTYRWSQLLDNPRLHLNQTYAQIEEAERRVPQMLRELAQAQELFRDQDLDGDGRANYCDDPKALQLAVERLPGTRAKLPALYDRTWPLWYPVRLHVSKSGFYAEVRYQATGPVPGGYDVADVPVSGRVYFMNHTGEVRVFTAEEFSRLRIDPEGCRILFKKRKKSRQR